MRKLLWLAFLTSLVVPAFPQSSQVPDAPSAQRPHTDFPTNVPPAAPAVQPQQTQQPQQQTTPAPSAQPSSVPQRTSPRPAGEDSREDFKFEKSVNLVIVPVTVKDSSGRLVDGLLKEDFSIYEDDVPQEIRLFTSDPFPLSTAIVVDTALPQNAMRKVRETLPALVGAFSQYDETSIYTYGNVISRVADYTASPELLNSSLRSIHNQGRTGGVPVTSGPMASGPIVNGVPLDPSVPHVPIVQEPSYVLNDAIFRAAQDLARRDPSRRRIIFVISDGREKGSHNSYNEVMKVLLSNNIAVYAIGVDQAAIPGVRAAGKVHIPGLGYTDILPKYVSASAGQYFPEFSQSAIEDAYAQVTGEARNQYTIGYNTKPTPSDTYRSIEVRVKRPGLKVYAKDGYFPLPPAPQH
jgi:VWFA-related protein